MIKLKIKDNLFRKWRVNRRPSNQLMMIWLKQTLEQHQSLDRAVDIGCGKGINRSYFLNPQYTGLDVNPVFTKVAQERYPADEFGILDVSEQDPPEGDLFVATLVFHNKFFPKDKVVESVERIVSKVRSGGCFVFTTGEINQSDYPALNAFLNTRFASVRIYSYGRFNSPSYGSIPLAYMMNFWPKLAEAPRNRMRFWVCSQKL